MGMLTLRRNRSAGKSGVVGIARLDRRTKRLTGRLEAGDIAIIDHIDIDRVAGDALVAAGVAAVVNVALSISGRYPNLGPGVLIRAGIPLLDAVGPHVMDAVKEGQQVSLRLRTRAARPRGGVLRTGVGRRYTGRMTTGEDVEEALTNGIDPELGLDFVELCLIYGIEVDGGKVHVTFSLTSPGCPIGPQVSEQSDEFVSELDGVESGDS